MDPPALFLRSTLTRRLILLALLLDLLVAGDAHATLIDLGGVTRDTATQLDWLDVTTTVGLSMNDIAADVGGYANAGWRHAKTIEVCDLFISHGAGLAPCPLNQDVSGNLNVPLINLLGITIAGPVSTESFGWFEGGFADIGFAGVYYRSDTNRSITGVIPEFPTLDGRDTASLGYGNFLVRPRIGILTGLFNSADK